MHEEQSPRSRFVVNEVGGGKVTLETYHGKFVGIDHGGHVHLHDDASHEDCRFALEHHEGRVSAERAWGDRGRVMGSNSQARQRWLVVLTRHETDWGLLCHRSVAIPMPGCGCYHCNVCVVGVAPGREGAVLLPLALVAG